MDEVYRVKGIIKKSSKEGVPFTQISDRFIGSAELSARAKWLFTYLWGKPVGWVVRFSDIVKQCTDGRESIKAARIELQEAGYLKHERERLARGLWGGTRWFLSEESVKDWIVHYSAKKPEANIRPVDSKPIKPEAGKPEAGKHACISNKEFSNKEISKSAIESSTKAKANREWLDAIVKKTSRKLIVRPPMSMNAMRRKGQKNCDKMLLDEAKGKAG